MLAANQGLIGQAAPPQQAAPQPAPQQSRAQQASPKEHFGRILVSLLKLLYSDGMVRELKGIIDQGDWVEPVAERIVVLLKDIDRRTGQQFPRGLIKPIAIYAGLDLLRWLSEEKIVEVTQDDMANMLNALDEMLTAEYQGQQ